MSRLSACGQLVMCKPHKQAVCPTFYELFVWQQADKNIQLEFVLKVLMGNYKEITLKNLSEIIDSLCSKIRLIKNTDSLQGFNEVMKKLLFDQNYEHCHSSEHVLTRSTLRHSL